MEHSASVTILSLCVLVSCESPTTKDTPVKRYIDTDSLAVCESMDELPYDVKFIKLETRDDCILGDIKKIQTEGANIFIEDFKERVFRFDTEGRFLNKIGTKGGSGSEYISLFDFFLDKKQQAVCIMDLSKGKLLRYDYDGKFVSSQDVDTELMTSAVGIAYVNENELITINCNGPGEEYQYSLINLPNAVSKQILPYVIIGEDRSVLEEGRIAQNSSHTYILSFMSDTIYSYSNGCITGDFLLRHKEPQFNKNSIQGKTFQTCYDAEPFFIKQSISVGIKSLYTTDSCLFFTYTTKDNYYRIYFNSEKNKGYIYDVRKNPDDVGSIVWNNVVANNEHCFIGVIPVAEYISNEYLKNKYPDLSELLLQSTPSDNPIVTYITIRQ